MALRKVLAALCIVAMIVTGIGLAIYLFTQKDAMSTGLSSSPRSSLVPPKPELPTVGEFKVGVQVTGNECAGNGVCTYTYSIEPNYVGFHPLPEREFAVFYEITGGNEPQPGNFTVSDGQARVYKDVKVDGPPGAQLQARVTEISPVAGPKAVPVPEPISPELLTPMPITTPGPQPASP